MRQVDSFSELMHLLAASEECGADYIKLNDCDSLQKSSFVGLIGERKSSKGK